MVIRRDVKKINILFKVGRSGLPLLAGEERKWAKQYAVLLKNLKACLCLF